MIKNWTLYVFILLVSSSWSQQTLEPIDLYHKDRLWSLNPALPSSFLPQPESQFALRKIISDSSKQYYILTQKLYKEYLFEIKGDGYRIDIQPVLDIGRGNDKADTNPRTLFNNTRGFSVDIDLLEKFSLSTAYYENQNRFTLYEHGYYNSIGERYPSSDTTYRIENAVIPGAARTKPFKEDAYDYGYAIGTVVYRPNPYLTFMGGNNQCFIGRGYRSLFLSDNSVPSTYIRTDIQFQNLSYSIYRSKHFSLLRRPFRTTVEAYYEQNLFSSQFLSYRPAKWLQVSYFEGSKWWIGDSVSTTKVDPSYYLPLPFVTQTIAQNDSNLYSLNGLQLELSFASFCAYSQLAINGTRTDKAALQLGVRIYPPKLKGLLFQMEYNNVPDGIYSASRNRLNYAAYNLPLAHPKGQSFQEVTVRMSYTYQRFYLDAKWVHYTLESYQNTPLVVSPASSDRFTQSVFHQQLEIGYRFNPRNDLKVFARHLFRTENVGQFEKTQVLMLGLSTAILNHYNDF